MSTLLVIGAGAIGRGYLPRVFSPDDYRFLFVDSNPAIIRRMRDAGGYTTHYVCDGKVLDLRVPVAGAWTPAEFDPAMAAGAAACFINVGPRNVVTAARLLGKTSLPVVLCENDPMTVTMVKAACGLDRVYFAVPDVITSNTASPEQIARDPLAVVTEDGVLFIDEEATGLIGTHRLLPHDELIRTQWTAKLYLHNTPHCVAAYLGALVGVTYVHEAMANPEVAQIVQGTMDEMLRALKLKWDIPHGFLDWYAAKEMQRFACPHLYDPISRVAREPLRKLEPEGRLMGAAQICLSLGFIPENILIGIAGAMLFDNEDDADYHLAFMQRALPLDGYLSHVLNLRPGEALEIILREQLGRITEQLGRLRVRKGEAA